DDDSDLEAAARAERRRPAVRELGEPFAPGREHAVHLDVDRRVAEARRHLEGHDAAMARDAVHVEVADEAGRREAVAEAAERLADERDVAGPEHRRAHLAGRRADLAVEEPLVLEVDARR